MAVATYYEILGVSKTANQAEIRKAYLRASLRCHPDKNPGKEDEAKAEFIQIGTAYSCLKDETSRAAYDRELSAGKFNWRPQQRPPSNATTNNEDEQAKKDKEFDNFMDLFDETVSGMSEAELNMAMGAAAVVGSIIGSIVGARAGKGNSFISSAASMMGSAMASRAASTLVETVHEDSKQRVIDKEERKEAIARGESVQEQTPRDNRERLFKDASAAFGKVATAAAFAGNNSTTTSNNNNGSRASGGGINWSQAAKMAAIAVGAVQEMQSKQQQERHR